MDSLFAKVIFLFSFLLASIISPDYIKVDQNDLIFNFKTGEIYPIYYYLNVQNIGPEKERFEISSNQSWVSVYREGTDSTFVELPSQAYINFVLGIRPERLADGVNKAKINLRVLDIDSLVSQELVLDQAEVSIVLNKNIVPTESPEIIIQTLSPVPISTPTPTLTPQPTKALQTTLPASSDLNPILKQIQSLINSIQALLKRFF